jgi:hypothetical protein
MTGALPIIAIINWRALSATSRTLLVVGLLYLGVILAGGEKHLHYLTPLPWILLPAAVDASSDRWRWATGGAIAVLALAFAFSWPAAGQARTENADLGRQSCVQGFDYETAALRSGGIYAALDQPPRSGRFAIGKHTFVRYALDLGGTDCVLGLSLAPPVGAILLVDGPAALWTTDPDRYAAWRFRQVAVPVSRLFPFATASPLPAKAGDWLGRQDLEQPRGRALILSVSTPAGAQAGTVQMRLLAPVAGPRRELVLGLAAPAAGRLQFSVNGGRLSATPLTRGEQTVGVWAGDLRDGWNVLTLGLASGVALRWLEGR